jgi:hypothetical protein
MKVLDLFSGLGGWSQAFRDRGHEVITVDIEPKFKPDICMDIMDMNELPACDLILASPPCECFSVASISRHWTISKKPKDEQTEQALKIMKKTFELCMKSGKHYFIENPRGMMRKMAPLRPTTTVWYCRYGDTRAKPTDIWTNANIPWKPKCHNGCSDHESARRGSKGGTQGMSCSSKRAVIPYGLSEWVCVHMERILTEGQEKEG